MAKVNASLRTDKNVATIFLIVAIMIVIIVIAIIIAIKTAEPDETIVKTDISEVPPPDTSRQDKIKADVEAWIKVPQNLPNEAYSYMQSLSNLDLIYLAKYWPTKTGETLYKSVSSNTWTSWYTLDDNKLMVRLENLGLK